jgi:hypothetical protein
MVSPVQNMVQAVEAWERASVETIKALEKRTVALGVP